jgi:hypothetical protein
MSIQSIREGVDPQFEISYLKSQIPSPEVKPVRGATALRAASSAPAYMGKALSSQSEREGKAPVALLLEGATQAPLMVT